jgi:hypothetical protein
MIIVKDHQKEDSILGKKQKFSHKFVGEGEEELEEIFKRQFVRYVNDQKGYSYLTLKKQPKKEKQKD